jgi:cyclopropane fatty-acyl-phospholipid synthase-like methyltransferase
VQDRHSNLEQYFNEQARTTERYVIPYINEVRRIDPSQRVLEIGCSMGGNLVPFLDLGCTATGVDLSASSIQLGEKLFAGKPHRERLTLITDDIYHRSEADGKFDIIIMRDVIEHIHNQDKFMGFVHRFMAPGAVFFLAFPPWYNPFGGHQQICTNKLLSKLPYFHLLPSFLYKMILKSGGESPSKIEALLEIKATGISLERFERLAKKHGYTIARKTHYLINPNYETKFGLKPREQFGIIRNIPFFRNFLTTAGYYALLKK